MNADSASYRTACGAGTVVVEVAGVAGRVGAGAAAGDRVVAGAALAGPLLAGAGALEESTTTGGGAGAWLGVAVRAGGDATSAGMPGSNSNTFTTTTRTTATPARATTSRAAGLTRRAASPALRRRPRYGNAVTDKSASAASPSVAGA